MNFIKTLLTFFLFASHSMASDALEELLKKHQSENAAPEKVEQNSPVPGHTPETSEKNKK